MPKTKCEFKKIEINEDSERRLAKFDKEQIAILKKGVEKYNQLVDKVKKEDLNDDEKLRKLQEAYDVINVDFRHCIKFV